MALDVVCGADFSCKLICGASPCDLGCVVGVELVITFQTSATNTADLLQMAHRPGEPLRRPGSSQGGPGQPFPAPLSLYGRVPEGRAGKETKSFTGYLKAVSRFFRLVTKRPQQWSAGLIFVES